MTARDGPIALYRQRLASGALQTDPVQALAAEKLQALHRSLQSYEPQSGTPPGWFARWRAVPEAPVRPRGLYIYGGVGRGKSMLMDLFFEASTVRLKRRVHFHAFMQEVHRRLGDARAARADDPLPAVGRAIAAEAWLLCFDEFQVSDIADAMLLGRLFETLFGLGVVVVATSNRAPDRLYEGGLHRDRFLPFIELIARELDVLELDNGRDYRRARVAGRPVYYTPLNAAAEASVDAMFRDLTDGETPVALTLTVNGRALPVARQAAGTARFGFAELCGRPLGAADYLALARQFDTIVIDGVPSFSPERRNEAIRFTTLIDVLYEARTHVVMSAAAPPDGLYPEGDGAFEFRRTVSRLSEMQSAEYLAHRPGAHGMRSAPIMAGRLAARSVSG